MDEAVVLGISSAVREMEEDIALAARSDARVLVTGESGVGKVNVARLIHDRGLRARSPFISVLCASAASPGLESDVLDGAASLDRSLSWRRRLEAADGGTVFLAGVCDANAGTQVLIVRFLETGVLPGGVGGERDRSVDVRVIASTHRMLADQVAEQRFRSDLYYRLNVVHIVVPPLRDRQEDVVFLMNHFLGKLAGEQGVPTPALTPDARQRLTDYHWPGNLRELRRVAERLVRHCTDGWVGVDDLPGEVWLHPGATTRCARTDRASVLKLVHPRHNHVRCD